MHQVRPEDEGLPGPSSKPYRQVWEGKRLEEIEKIIWNNVILPKVNSHNDENEIDESDEENEKGGGRKRGRKKDGLINCNWEEWAKGGLKRKALYKKQHPNLQTIPDPVNEEDLKLNKKGKGKEKVKSGSMSEPETTRLGLFPFTTSSSNTPSKATSSVPPSPLPNVEDNADENEKIRQMERWCEKLRGLVGFQNVTEGDCKVDDKDQWQMLKGKYSL